MKLFKKLWNWLDDSYCLWSFAFVDLFLIYTVFGTPYYGSSISHFFRKLVVVTFTVLIYSKLISKYWKLFRRRYSQKE